MVNCTVCEKLFDKLEDVTLSEEEEGIAICSDRCLQIYEYVKHYGNKY